MMDSDDLRHALKKLESIGQKLKLTSIVLLTATLLNLCLICASLGKIIYLGKYNVTLVSVVITFGVVFLALWFDVLRKDGKAYYDEISGVMHASSKNDNIGFLNESIVARVAVRKFMNSHEIPLVPGKYGPGVLVISNVMIIVLWITITFKDY